MKKITCFLLAIVLGLSSAFISKAIYIGDTVQTETAKSQANIFSDTAEKQMLDISDIKLSDYTVVTPRAASYIYISELQKFTETVNALYGYDITIVDDRQSEMKCEILVGLTNRSESQQLNEYNGYEIFMSDSKIVINGGSDQALGAAVRYLTENISNINLTSDFEFCGTFEPAKDDYKLVWNDEFDENILSDKWTKRVQGFASAQGGTVKYTDSTDNTFVTNGTLKQASLRVNGTDDSYTCSYIHTADSMTFVYGIAEIRAKLPTGNGVWPAFWCNNMNTATEAYLEIDIFEMFPGVTNRLEFTLHKWWTEYDSSTLQAINAHESVMGNNGLEIVKLDNENIGDDWHTIGMVWTKDSIRITFDGYVKCEQKITGENTAFFHSPVHFILNNICGLSATSVPDENTPFPSIFETDYIRLYQTDNEGKIYFED